ncbi:MAG TPA: hypothetical protein VEV64_05610 [Rhizomicrobium sp.]|nr:hypothetical protein [Rhizomicrobium sp.]
MLRTASAAIALLALANPALAAGCATPNEAAALRTAVIQQELMVAALQCHETAAYNRFVMTYRGELQASDATLKTFFVRRGGEHGEAGYDTFKTKAANLSALEQARNGGAFCADAHALFASAFANRASLMSFVDAHAASTDLGGICAESRPVLASAKPMAGAVKVADEPASEIGGVPSHNLPPMPYRRQESIVAQAPDYESEEAEDQDEPLAPPPRPSYQRGYYPDRAYDPREYSPPPGWRGWRDVPPPPPRYGWYSY